MQHMHHYADMRCAFQPIIQIRNRINADAFECVEVACCHNNYNHQTGTVLEIGHGYLARKYNFCMKTASTSSK